MFNPILSTYIGFLEVIENFKLLHYISCLFLYLFQKIILFLYFTVHITLTSAAGFDTFSTSPIFNDDLTSENMHFFGPPSDSFWRQFWDVFNYKGPLQENPFFRPVDKPIRNSLMRPIIRPLIRPVTVPFFSNSGFYEQYPGQELFIPETETTRPVTQEVTSEHEDEYNRYRDYFYRRYGPSFVDEVSRSY